MQAESEMIITFAFGPWNGRSGPGKSYLQASLEQRVKLPEADVCPSTHKHKWLLLIPFIPVYVTLKYKTVAT